MNQRLTGWLTAIVLALLSPAAAAQAPLAEGPDYSVITPALATDNPAKIEVIEFFSYACPHCYDLNPKILQWAKKLPSDVVFKRVPAGFNPFYQLMAKLYYSLEAIGELERLDGPVFEAIQVKGIKLVSEKSITEWLVAQNVDARKFSEAWNSFSVSSKIRRADQIIENAKVHAVPSLVVDGCYLVVGQNIKSQQDLLALTDRIIDMRRKERARKK